MFSSYSIGPTTNPFLKDMILFRYSEVVVKMAVNSFFW